jgi:hypothetical protein
MPKTLLDGFGEATEQVVALRAEVEQLTRERDQAREHRDYVTGQQWDAVAAWEDKVLALSREVEEQTRLANVAAERMRTAEYRESLLKQDVERYQALLRETLELWRIEVERLASPKGAYQT